MRNRKAPRRGKQPPVGRECRYRHFLNTFEDRVQERVASQPPNAYKSCCDALYRWVYADQHEDNPLLRVPALRAFWWRAFCLHARCTGSDPVRTVQRIDSMHPAFLKSVAALLRSMDPRDDVDLKDLPHSYQVLLKIVAGVPFSRAPGRRKLWFLNKVAFLFSRENGPLSPFPSAHSGHLE